MSENNILLEESKSIKPKRAVHNSIVDEYCCPYCNVKVGEKYMSIIFTSRFSYCPGCGRLIDWSDLL